MNQAHADTIGKLLLRVVLGALLLFHGVSKITGGISGIEGMVVSAGLPGYVAYGVYVGEVLAPLMLILGAWVRAAAIVVIGNMVFAVYLVHQGDLLKLNGTGGWALELQAFYFFTALAILFFGPGRIALTRH